MFREMLAGALLFSLLGAAFYPEKYGLFLGVILKYAIISMNN